MGLADVLASPKLILVALATVGAVQGVSIVHLIGSPDTHWTSTCETWDRGARNALSIHENSTPPALAADVEQSLRRAREYCDAGRVGIAMQAYDAVRAAHDVLPTTLAATPVGKPFK